MKPEYNINDTELKNIIPDYNGEHILSYCDIAEFYPERKRNTNKGDYGSANIVAGSKKYPGAAVLSALSALKSGCGYVKLTSDESVKSMLVYKLPSVIYLDECDLKSQAIAIGMGYGASKELFDKIKFLTRNFNGILIIDADGLNSVAKYGSEVLKDSVCKIILTPHLKEFSRLTNTAIEVIAKSPVKTAVEFAKNFGITLLLKGAVSVITDGTNTVLNTRGSTALAKGGSGDMLSGYMAGCAARGLSAFDVAKCSAFTLGLSAEICSEQKTDYCATAQDILDNLHFAVKRLTGKN